MTDTVNVHPHTPTFLLNVNCPNTAIKTERLSEQIKTRDSNLCWLQDTHSKQRLRFKGKGWRKTPTRTKARTDNPFRRDRLHDGTIIRTQRGILS